MQCVKASVTILGEGQGRKEEAGKGREEQGRDNAGNGGREGKREERCDLRLFSKRALGTQSERASFHHALVWQLALR